jgi:AraC-like DNA-binding protein
MLSVYSQVSLLNIIIFAISITILSLRQIAGYIYPAQRGDAACYEVIMYKLQVRDDLGEDMLYTSARLPIYSVEGRLSRFLRYRAACHWHEDIEFIVVTEGEMTYHVNDRCYPLGAGDGIFVNAGRLHFGAADEAASAGALKGGAPPECVFRCLRLHPSLLCAHPYIENRFVNPLRYDNRFDALFFPAAATDWRALALERIGALAELTRRSPDDAALQTQSRFYELWSLLFEQTAKSAESEKPTGQGAANREDLAVKRMIGFIHRNFSEKITLDDIAKAGLMSRSKCCRIFKQALRASVFEYLLHFRIRRSLSLLTDERMSITEVAFASGFSAASYYGEIFKRLLGMSPGEYRQKFRSGEPLPRM